jgi:hypothetical protein
MVVTLISTVAVLVAGVLAVRMNQTRIQGRDLLERLVPLVEQEDLDAVAETLLVAGIPLEARALAPIRERVAGFLSVTTSPPGSEVIIRRVSPIESFGDRLESLTERTPVDRQPIVAGEYLLSVPMDDIHAFSALVAVGVGDSATVALMLPTLEEVRSGFFPVSAGPSPDGTLVDAFLIARTEVTNDEYSRFVDAGGYRDASLWPEEMTFGGRIVNRDAALAQMVDRTGLPGPRGWSSGQPPPEKSNHPVTGVSWYEARAYAAWMGAELPTLAEWYRAALADGTGPFPWGTDVRNVGMRANFGFAGTETVGSYPLGVSPFGVLDMAGNVREWVADEIPGSTRRIVVGGSWRDPAYLFERGHAEGFEPDTNDETIGFRLVKPPPTDPE